MSHPSVKTWRSGPVWLAQCPECQRGYAHPLRHFAAQAVWGMWCERAPLSEGERLQVDERVRALEDLEALANRPRRKPEAKP